MPMPMAGAALSAVFCASRVGINSKRDVEGDRRLMYKRPVVSSLVLTRKVGLEISRVTRSDNWVVYEVDDEDK